MDNDRHLQSAVMAELAWEPSIKAAHIGVTAASGVVTLTGHVSSFAQKHAADEAARRVKGVRAVAEEIEVRLSPETTRADDEIAAAAVERLSWNAEVPRDAVKISVADGWVTLTGEVAWQFQRAIVEQDLRRLHGVIGLSNDITIQPQVNVDILSDDITHALHRSWFFDPKLVEVTARGGAIRLTGVVHTLHDRNLAAITAWSTPGVTHVDNDIAVV